MIWKVGMITLALALHDVLRMDSDLKFWELFNCEFAFDGANDRHRYSFVSLDDSSAYITATARAGSQRQRVNDSFGSDFRAFVGVSSLELELGL
jgi:hypothetical protein